MINDALSKFNSDHFGDALAAIVAVDTLPDYHNKIISGGIALFFTLIAKISVKGIDYLFSNLKNKK